MKFLIGSQNFGLDMPDSDKDYFKFVYPELKDLCNPIPKNKESKEESDSLTKIIDIRSVPSLFFKSNLDILQLLYSKEVNDGGNLERYFREYEQELSTINLPRLYKSVMGTAMNRFKRGTSKDLAHNIFGFKLLLTFAENGFKDMRSCFEHNEQLLYRAIRNESYEAWLPSAKSWEELALNKKEVYMKMKPNEKFKRKFDEDIGRMVIDGLDKSKSLRFSNTKELEVLELALMDSYVNSEALQAYEKKILNKLYHRLRDDEELYYNREEDEK